MTGRVNSGAQTVSLPILHNPDQLSAQSSLGRHCAASTVSFCRLPVVWYGFMIGPSDNTARSAMTIPIQIQNQSLVSHTFPPTFQINTRQSFAASATAERLVTNHELQPIGGRRGVPFKSMVIRFRSTNSSCTGEMACPAVLSRVLSLSQPGITGTVATVPTSTCNSSCLALLSKTSPRCFRYTFSFLFDSTFHVHIRTLHHLWCTRNRLPPLSTSEA